TNLSSPEARFAIRAPKLENVLPYTYARNAKNGTPLYKSVPTVEQMRQYEPYLVKKAEEPAESSPEKARATAPALTAPPKPEEAPPLPFTKEAMARGDDRERKI